MQILVSLLCCLDDAFHKLAREYLSRRSPLGLFVWAGLIRGRRILIVLFKQSLFTFNVFVHKFPFRNSDIVWEDLRVVLIKLINLSQSYGWLTQRVRSFEKLCEVVHDEIVFKHRDYLNFFIIHYVINHFDIKELNWSCIFI